MAGKIVWSQRAKTDLFEILQYWRERNKSNIYSIKLNALIQNQLALVIAFPKIGRETDIPNVRVKIIKDYLIFYEIVKKDLHVLIIRHEKRSLKATKI